MTRLQADLVLLLCAAIWGVAFLFQKGAMEHVGPWTFVGARGIVAAVVLLPLALFEHRWRTAQDGARVDQRTLLWFSALAGVAFLAAALLQQDGLKTASVINASFLTALYVVITPFLSYALTRRALAPEIWFAAGLSFVGTWLLGGGSLSGDGFGGFQRGETLVALSALFWSMHVLIVAAGARGGRPVLFTALQFLVVGGLASAGAAALETPTLDDLRAAAGDILFVGVLSSALTFTLFTWALRVAPPAEAAIIASTETLFASFAGWLMLGERMTAAAMVGAAAILTAIVLVQARRRARG